ncbi:MAG: hypothetical protein LBE24_03135 [Methylobacillus sp.]|jgi:hypothetical protein|nr:hypothetical protein [Methylobacillus sp.]
MKWMLCVLMLLVSINATAAEEEKSPLSGVRCNSNGECGATFDETVVPEVKTFCPGNGWESTVRWKKGDKLILVQCNGFAIDVQSTWGYVVSGNNVLGMKYYTTEAIAFLQHNPAESIYYMGNRDGIPACSPAKQEKLGVSTFVLLVPQNNCYEIAYLTASGKGVRLENNAGVVGAGNANYFVKGISAQIRNSIKKLVQITRKWRDQHPDQGT